MVDCTMDVAKLLAELRAERARIEEAIIALERLGGMSRRGRKPAWMTDGDGNQESGEAEETTPRKRSFSPEARKRMAEAQRKRWAAARGETE